MLIETGADWMKAFRGHGAVAAASATKPRRHRLVERLAIVVALLLSAWLLWPALTPAHVEGYSASLAALGLHWTQGTMASFDQLEPLNTEYFGLTKLGMVLSIGGVAAVLHVSADLAFRLLMWSGLIMLLSSSAWLIRRWSGAGWTVALAPLLILPGVVESSYTFCDNVLAAGLASCALCLLYGRSLISLAVAGSLFAFAVLTRTDTVLIAVAIPVILVERFGISRRALIACTVCAVPGAVVLFGTLAAFAASPLDLIRIGAAAVAAWARPANSQYPITITLYFLGLAGFILVSVGTYVLVRRKELLPAIRLLAAPAVLIFIMRNNLWETRQLLALTPFVGALAAIALRAIFESVDTTEQRLFRALTVGLIAVTLVGPATGAGFADGPRVFTGRVWEIPVIRQWQDGARRDVAGLDGLVARSRRAPLTILIADGLNEDRYLHLSLLDRGFRINAPTTLPLACRAAADHYQRGAAHFVIVRNYQSFVPYARALTAERFERRSLPCIRSLGPARLLLASTSVHLAHLLPLESARPVLRAPADYPRLDRRIYAWSNGPVAVVALDRSGQDRLLAAYRREVAADIAAAGQEKVGPKPTIADGIAATRARIRFPG